MEHLLALCEAMHLCEPYTYKTALSVYCPAGPTQLPECIATRSVLVLNLRICDLWWTCYISYRFNKPNISLRNLVSWLLPLQHWDLSSLLSILIQLPVYFCTVSFLMNSRWNSYKNIAVVAGCTHMLYQASFPKNSCFCRTHITALNIIVM